MSRDQHIKSLSSELASLQTGVREALAENGMHQGEAMALVKLCKGLSMPMWQEAAQRHGLNGFLPLPVKGELHPHVFKLMDILEAYATKLQLDPATGLANAQAFETLLDMELERALRNRHSLSLVLVSLQPGSLAEDPRFGDGQGGLVAALSELFSRRIRRYDFAARIGPTSFALLFPGSGLHRVRLLMDRLLAEMDKTAVNLELPKGLARAGLAGIKGRRRINVKDFRQLAVDALAKAMQPGESPIQDAPIPDIAAIPPGSLVQSYEKLFLFTGQ